MADVASPPLQESLDFWGPGTTTVAYPVASSSSSPPDLSCSSSSSSTSPFSPFSATFSPTSPFSSTFDPYASYAPFSPTTPSATSAVIMTDIMSYQYPAPPANGGSTAHMTLSPAGYHMPMSAADYANGIPQTSSSSGLGRDSHSSPRERRDSLSKSSSVNMKLKRSLSTTVVAPQQTSTANANMSTPQQQGLSQPDHAALSLAAEKRRNKLGYHRTSVACGHCRRRKIRCIPSPADIQARCVNCIRLKKECSFYPVDQQPPPDTRKNSTSRSSVGHHHHHLSSASTVPAAASAPLMPAPTQLPLPSLAALPNADPRGRPQQSNQPLTMPSIQTMAPPSMKLSGGEPFSPDPKMSGRNSFDYSHSGMTNWMSADASPSSSKPGDISWRSYPQESPTTPAFSPYTTHAAPPSATWASDAARGSDDLGWSYPPPPRSLSFGSDTISSHHGHQQQAYPSVSQVTSGHHHGNNGSSHRSSSSSYDRKSSAAAAAAAMSDLYQSPTTIPGVDSIPGTTLDHHVSLTVGAAGTTAYSNWQQPYSYSKDGSDAYVGWGDHSGTAASEGHVASSMYYTGR